MLEILYLSNITMVEAMGTAKSQRLLIPDFISVPEERGEIKVCSLRI